ncbi:transposase [Bradyrhizobium ottawaense]|uniref:transposase n=1 Tax=Bradyrhizobium ottawaense TaxID=931866 RepID=UPI003514624F
MHEVSTKIGGHLVMADDDQKLRVRLVGRNGRRRYEAASKERLVATCLEPGVSVSRLALEHGVNANLLRKWIKKHTPRPGLCRHLHHRRSSGFSLRRPPIEPCRDKTAWRRLICRRLAMKCAGRNPRGLQLFVL